MMYLSVIFAALLPTWEAPAGDGSIRTAYL